MIKNKAIKSSIIVMILIIMGKVLALVRDSLIAANFGATYVTDIYNFALGIVYLLTTIGYGLTTTFIPLHTENIHSSSKEDKGKFVNNVINVFMIATLIVTVILIIFAKYIIFIFAPGFNADPKVFESAVGLTRIMLLSLVFISLQSVVTGVLQSHKQFLEPAAMAFVSNLVYIIYLVFLTKKYGMNGFAIAIVLGFFMQFIINVPKFKKLGYKYKPFINTHDAQLKNMFKLMIPVVISTSVIQLNVFVNRSFATSIYFGAVTVLDFANKVNTLAYEVFAIGIAMIIFPTLSELAVAGKREEFKKSLIQGINIILLIMVPAAVAIAILRMPLIIMIFKRGAFDAKASLLTANALLFFTPAMIAYGVRDILNKAYYSIKDMKTPMINSFVGILLNIVINIFIVKYMAVSGLTLATSISVIVTTILMFISLNKKLEGINLRQMFKTFAKIVSSSAIMGIVIFFINHLSILRYGASMKGSLVSIFASFIFGVIVYLVCIYLFKIKEFLYIVNLYKNRKSA